MPSQAFARFWQTHLTRDAFLSHTTKDDLCTLRLVSHDFANVIAAPLFKTTKVNFHVNSFSRRQRMAALDRIGHHVRTLHFHIPHTEATFLPPLIDPETLEEISFLYEPQAFSSRPSSSSSCSSFTDSSDSKYGSWEINDILVRQYPPLFHAATNVISFMRALKALPCLRHLRISCPDQPAGQRYRRDIIDYALISLRIAVEHANPQHLDTLSLDPVHPGAIYYLRPQTSLGTSPASTRVWHRIKTLNITMDSFPYLGPDSTTDHLKILHTYLQTFRSLTRLNFSWLGEPGPCPVSLDTELLFTSDVQSPSHSRSSSLADRYSLSSSSSTTTSCNSSFFTSRPIRFRHLKSMHLHNATLDATQASSFIMLHRKVLHEVDFANCHLRSGTWDDALEPLTRHVSAKLETTSIRHLHCPEHEVMDVPIVFTPTEDIRNPFAALPASDTMAAMNGEEVEYIKEQLWGDDIMRQTDVEYGLSKGIRALHVLRRVGHLGVGTASYRSPELGTAVVGGMSKGARGFEGVKRFLKGVKVVGCGWH